MTLQILLCSGIKIYYIVPNGTDTTNCLFQPCATLDYYLLNNSSFTSVSDVQFHILSGEYILTSSLTIREVCNFMLLGITNSNSQNIILKLDLDASIIIYNSNNVTLSNILLIRHNANWKEDLVTLQIVLCISCKVENVTFDHPYGVGMMLVNMMGMSHLKNIKMYIRYTDRNSLTQDSCSQGFFMRYEDNDTLDIAAHMYNTIHLNNIAVKGKRSDTTFACPICGSSTKSIFKLSFEQTRYSVTVMVKQAKIYNIIASCRSILEIKAYPTYSAAFHLNFLYFENLIFSNNILRVNNDVVNSAAIKMSISNMHISVHFVSSLFISNFVHFIETVLNIVSAPLVSITITNIQNFMRYKHSMIVTFDSSLFKFNKGQLLNVTYVNYLTYFEDNTQAVIVLTGNLTISKNICFSRNLISIERVNTIFNGTVSFIGNTAISSSILAFKSCTMVFYNITVFAMNRCGCIMSLKSQSANAPIGVTEYANITFLGNTYDQLISIEVDNDYREQFPFCLFQYLPVNTTSIYFVPVSHFTIILKDNINRQTSISWINYLSHCEWLPFALYHEYHPGAINKQIIQFHNNLHPYPEIKHHNSICYCSSDEEYNCSIDVLGPVFPGQKLQVGLLTLHTESSAFSDSIMHVETHAPFLLNSACRLIHQSELINLVNGHCNAYNFTISIASNLLKECELFLTIYDQYNMHKFHDAFYIRLLVCPIGFKLLNGLCDCDPLLSDSELNIGNCYIDESSIQRPTNTWIFAHTEDQSNGTEYLFSRCPMDYCLPFSSHVNLLYPDTQCQFKRSGTLCSQCQHGFSMVFGSSKCMKCTNKYVFISVIIIVVGIILVALLYFLKLTVTNGSISGVIFYANIISINGSAFLINGNLYEPLKLFISFTNLDLGIETCFYNGMDSYVKMWLQLFFPLYLITIVTIIIIVSRYSYKIQRLTRTRSLPVVATLFLLSYTSVLRAVSTVLFSYSTITKLPSGQQELVWSIDASVQLFEFKFIMLFITCLIIFLILIPFNFVLLFTRYLAWFKIVYRFKPLLDAFQGSYKYQYYYWIAVNILLRNLFYVVSVFTLELSLTVSALVLIMFTALNGYIQPNKNNLINIQELLLLVNLSIMYTTAACHPQWGNIVVNIMVSIAFLQFCVIVLIHFFMYTCKFRVSITVKSVKAKIMKFCHMKTKNHQLNDVKLLNIPECTYNYKEYRDGLVSDDFKAIH